MITKKQLLWLIAIAIMVIIISVACKRKPTNVEDFLLVEEAPGQAGEIPQPEKKLPIDTNQGLIQFKGLSFKSGGYILNGDYSKIIYYYADVKVDSDSKPYISVLVKDADGNIIEDEGKFYNILNETGAIYNLEGIRYKSNNRNTAVATFIEDGYLRIKFSNYSLDITYSLIEGMESNLYIPKEYCGRYTVKGVGSLNWGDEAYSGYWKDIYWDIKPNSISFTGGDFFTIKSATITSGNFHDIYHNGGLIVTTDFTNGGVMYYLFLHEGNNYTMRTTNTLGNAPYYTTHSSKDY